VCCAGPLLVLLGGIGVASLAAAVLVPALGVLAVITAAAVWLLTRRLRARTGRPAAQVFDLRLPGPAPAPPSTRTVSGTRR
jgi:hypothetical protein